MQSDPDVARCARLNPVVPLTNPPGSSSGFEQERKSSRFSVFRRNLPRFLFFFFFPKQQHGPSAVLGWGGGTQAVIPEHGGGSGGGWGGDGRGSLMSL